MSLPATCAAATSRRLTVLLVSFLLVVAGLLTPSVTTSARATTSLNVTSFAYLMLGALNNNRSWNHLGPLRMNSHLRLSAYRHDLEMAKYNWMSHQLPGEPYLGTRITRAGYHWRSAGENIGWTTDLSMRGIYNLEHAMYYEKPPNDDHRLNILNRYYRDIGITIIYDAIHHKLWFTQDFGQPA